MKRERSERESEERREEREREEREREKIIQSYDDALSFSSIFLNISL